MQQTLNAEHKRERRTKLPLKERSKLYHTFMKRTGRYSFIAKNTIRLILVLVLFAAMAWAITTYLIDVDAVTTYIKENFSVGFIVLILFSSESLLGLLPPDAFIVWANESFSPAWPMILLLATASYAGGVISWYIGKWLYRFPKVQHWVHVRFHQQVLLFRKFGGLLIFISAMTPLPFSPISIVAGLAEYRFSRYLIMAASRFLRFFLYAYIFAQVV